MLLDSSHYPITTSVDLKMLTSMRVLLSNHTSATDTAHRLGLLILLPESEMQMELIPSVFFCFSAVAVVQTRLSAD